MVQEGFRVLTSCIGVGNSFERFRKFIASVLAHAMPVISRNELVNISKKSGKFVSVQEPYTVVIQEPKDPISRKRFGHLAGPRNVAEFFGCVPPGEVRIIGPYGLIINRHGKLIIEPLGHNYKWKLYITVLELGIWSFLFQVLCAVFPGVEKAGTPVVNSAAFLFPREINARQKGDVVFGHWIGEQLPQLRAIEDVRRIFHEFDALGHNSLDQKGKQRDFPLLVNRNPKAWQLQSLFALGISCAEVIEAPSEVFRCKSLIISSLRNVHSKQKMEVDPIARQWVMKRFEQSIANAGSKTAETAIKSGLSILRQDAQVRYLINFDEISRTATNHGFTTFSVGAEFQEEVKSSLGATRVLALDGSGIFRLMFMPNCRELIEIYLVGHETRDVFFLLTQELGISHRSLPASLHPNSSWANDSKIAKHNSYSETSSTESYYLEARLLDAIFRAD